MVVFCVKGIRWAMFVFVRHLVGFNPEKGDPHGIKDKSPTHYT